MAPRLRPALVACLAALALSGAGCADDSPEDALEAATVPGDASSLTWVMQARPRGLDPLYADSPAESLASRQVFEPLASRVKAPYDSREAPGLASSVRASADFSVWTVRLREGVRFADGETLDAADVLANADRWLASAPGQELLPELLADAPRPGRVRFLLAEPDPRFARVLASPRLGIVSPRALGAANAGTPIGASSLSGAGSGPFELRERDGEGILLARNTGWWGSRIGFGPALDQVELSLVEGARERAGRLMESSAQVASGLGRDLARRIARDPLLTVVRVAGLGRVALERSVRGIASGDVPLLSSVWRTEIDSP